MNIFQRWGFREVPFNTEALRANEIGERLLIGREEEMACLIDRLHTPPNIPTLEAPNGVGKTIVIYALPSRAWGGCSSRPKYASTLRRRWLCA